MDEKTLQFNDIILNQKKSHNSKEPVDLFSVNVDQIVVSDKFEQKNKVFEHFIGYQKVKLLNHYALFHQK